MQEKGAAYAHGSVDALQGIGSPRSARQFRTGACDLPPWLVSSDRMAMAEKCSQDQLTRAGPGCNTSRLPHVEGLIQYAPS